MHVRLNTPKMIRVDGKRRRFEPGDWVEIGRHVARQWLVDGTASMPGLDNAEALVGDLNTCAVLVRGDKVHAKPFRSQYWKLAVGQWPGRLIRLRNLIWNPRTVSPTPKQAIVGFSRVCKTRPEYDAWDIAVMLRSGATAQHYGSDKEKAKTKSLIGTLRIPIYQTGMLWVRRTPAAKKLLRLWQEEIEIGADENHAFLRALYKAPVLICNLPPAWMGIR